MAEGTSGSAPDLAGAICLCPSSRLEDSGLAFSFDLCWREQSLRAFVIRYRGEVHGYLNRCTHVAMEMDYMPDRFFDETGEWLICATHGAVYAPDTGAGLAGPCRGGLIALTVREHEGMVYWMPDDEMRPAS